MNIIINGINIQNTKNYVEDTSSLVSLESSFGCENEYYLSFIPPKNTVEQVLNECARSTEVDNIGSNSLYNEKNTSTGMKIIRYIGKLFDSFYKHIVSFLKAIGNFFKNVINFITGKDELKQITLEPSQNYVIISGFRGLKKIEAKISIEEFRRSTKLTDENKTMVRCQKEQDYLASIDKLVENVNNTCKAFFENSPNAEQMINELTEYANQFKKYNFVNVSNDQDYIANIQTFLANPSAISKSISTKVIEKTKSLEYLPNAIQKAKNDLIKQLENANREVAKDINPKIKMASTLFASVNSIDNLIFKSSSGYVSILQELNYLINREIHAGDSIYNGLMYLNRDVKVVHYGSELFAIPFNFTFKRTEETAEKFDEMVIVARHCNEISHSGKGQTIDYDLDEKGEKTNIRQSDKSQWTAKFMAFLKENSREVKAVVGNDDHYNIYNFDIKIEEEGGVPVLLKCRGNVFKDNRKAITNIPDKVYHSSEVNEPVLKIMPNTGSYNAHDNDMGGIKGIGFTSSRIYAAISPCTRQGFPITTLLNTFITAATKIESMLKTKKSNLTDTEIAENVSKLEKFGKPLETTQIYEIDNVKRFKGRIFVDPEHRGGVSGKVTSLLTGNTQIEPAIYIETKEPIEGRNVTKELFKVIENKSKFANLYSYATQHKSSLLKWFFIS